MRAERSEGNDKSAERLRPRRLVVIGGLLLLPLIGTWIAKSHRSRVTSALAMEGERTTEQASSELGSRDVEAGAVTGPSAHVDTQPSSASASPPSPAARALEDYRRWAIYPPASRPASEQADEVRPHGMITTSRRLVPTAPNGARVRQSQDRSFLAAGDSAIVQIGVLPEDAAPLVVVHAELVRGTSNVSTSSVAASVVVQRVDLRDDGSRPDERAKDGLWTATVTPPVDRLADHVGGLEVRATVRVGKEEGVITFPFVYTGAPPAAFTGVFRDVVEDGSLALYAGVTVHRPGRYALVARLDAASGEPLAVLHFDDVLEAGAREVRFTAFGKLLRGAGASGPYLLRDVEGWLVATTEVGARDRELLTMWSGPYRTAAHARDVFSDAPWDSASKQRRLAMLERAASNRH